MTTPLRIPLSKEGFYLAAGPLQTVQRAKHTPMLVVTDGEESIIKAIDVEIQQTGRRFVADKITGGLYDPDTGRCMSSDRRRLIGPVPDGYVLKKREAQAFDYGYQAIGGKNPKGRAKKPAKDASRNESGKLCGEDKGGAKLTEADVLKIRARVPGTTHYVMTVSAAAKLFGVGPSTVVSARKRKTWRHLP